MIAVSPFSLRLVRPFVTSKGTTTHRDGFLIRATLDGMTGVGEGCPMPGMCNDSDEDIAADLSAAAGIVQAPPRAIKDLDAWVCDRATTSVVRHALASALLDAMAQVNQKSVARTLNSHAIQEVPVSHLYSDDDALFHAAMLGCQTVKIKVGVLDLAQDIQKVAGIRALIGPDIDLRLDANGAWTEDEAKAAIEAFAPMGVRTIEDPVDPSQFATMARLRGQGIAIAADEAVVSMGALNGLLAANAVDAIVIKPMRVGTPMAALKLIQTADAYGLSTIVTTTIDGAVGRMMALHIAAAAPTSRLLACGLNTGSWLAEDHGATPDMSGSHVDTPTAPGLGLL